MTLTLIRDTKTATATLGKLYLDGVRICETLELPWKDNKTGISCIPTGTYKVVKRHSPKYKDHLHVLDVPGRSWILFHPANRTSELRGCIAPGVKRLSETVEYSRKAMAELLRLTANAKELTLTVE